jgi:dTDP-D-glucose 4,6-dehydratase
MVLRRIAGLFGKEMEADRLIGSLTVDDSRIRQDLGWRPPFTIEHGIEKTIDWYRNMRRV